MTAPAAAIGATPLMSAAARGHAANVRLLLRHGATETGPSPA